ncbi:DUF2513 domain-containing protein [Pseudomonas sivasensis]|uniref:DUF2513 domain-containing protein n=1 Tax=Bacteria TaxID=2 RepID=UPI003322B6FC
MKRNFDCVKDILLDLEEQDKFHKTRTIEATDKYSKEEIFYHYTLLKQAGLINAGKIYYDIPFMANLTWEGHNFLDDAKNQTVWEKTKEIVKTKGGSISFDIFAEVLKKTALSHFNME